MIQYFILLICCVCCFFVLFCFSSTGIMNVTHGNESETTNETKCDKSHKGPKSDWRTAC